jgi:hypothetical protein
MCALLELQCHWHDCTAISVRYPRPRRENPGGARLGGLPVLAGPIVVPAVRSAGAFSIQPGPLELQQGWQDSFPRRSVPMEECQFRKTTQPANIHSASMGSSRTQSRPAGPEISVARRLALIQPVAIAHPRRAQRTGDAVAPLPAC